MQMTKAKRLLGEGKKLITKTYAVNNGFAQNTIMFLFHKLKLETVIIREASALLILSALRQLHFYRLMNGANYSVSHYK